MGGTQSSQYSLDGFRACFVDCVSRHASISAHDGRPGRRKNQFRCARNESHHISSIPNLETVYVVLVVGFGESSDPWP